MLSKEASLTLGSKLGLDRLIIQLDSLPEITVDILIELYMERDRLLVARIAQ